MSDPTWKAAERAVAAILGARRVPVTGRARGSAPDAEHPTLSIEIKHRKLLPDWLHDAMAQAEASQREGQAPIVVLHQARTPYKDSLVVLRLHDFIDLI